MAKELELNNYKGFVIAYNGAQIIDMTDGKLLFDKHIDCELIPYLDKKAKKNGFSIFTYSEDAIYTDSPFDAHIVREAELNGLPIYGVDDFPAAIDFNPCKCILVSDDEENLVGLENHWKKKLPGTADVFRSEDYFLEVVPPTVDKGNALALLMEMLKMEREEVIAIGDGVADVPMLQLAGLSVAMGNARDSVQACADTVTLPNSQEGVAVAIEKNVLATIRPTEVPLDLLNARARHALMGNLGIQYTYASETADVFRSEDYFLEVVPPTVDKGNALALLMEMLKMEREEVIAIGDGVADVPMLQLAGLSVAMGNARDSVQACADTVTLPNSQEGVAVAIEKNVLATIRPTEVPLDLLNARARHALMGNLGIQYTYASETRVEATMPVDERTRQPFGILHGGATLALAETVAGLGSMLLVQPDEIVVGMQVSGNHISSAHEGDTVRAVATILHRGRSSHVWNVDIFTSTDRLVSSVRVMNSVMKKK